MIKFKNIKRSRKKTIILVGIFMLAIIAIFSITKNYLNCSDVKVDCSRVGDMLTPRFDHLTTVLNDGKVLIVGGYNAFAEGGSLARDVNVYAAELFDPETKQFGSIGTANYPHRYKMSIKTKEGKIVFINFIDSNYNMWDYYEIEIFDPKQNKFIKSNIPPFKRYLSACYIGNNKVLLILGSSHRTFGSSNKEEKEYNNSDLYLYDVNSDTLSKVGIIDDVLNAPHLIKTNENKVLLLDSNKAGIYSIDLKDFKTKKVGNLALPRMEFGSNYDLYTHDVFKINKNEILVVAGVGEDYKLEIYNTQTNTWSLLDNINIKNTEHTFLGQINVYNSFYQIDDYNYLVMQNGKIFYLLNIKDKTLKKICGLNIDTEYPAITFLNNNQILLTGGKIYGLASSVPTSQNKVYLCKIKYTE